MTTPSERLRRLTVAAGAGGEPGGTSLRLARADRRQTQLGLACERIVDREVPLLVGRSAVAAEATLGKGREFDGEMRRGAWLAHPATSELVFRVPPEELWHHLLRLRDRWPERLLAEAPDDLSWN